jgi:hypothetical protein
MGGTKFDDLKTIQGGMEIEQDLRLERSIWIAERIGWTLMGLFVLGALAGLVGPGPFNDAKAAGPAGRWHMDYERRLHFRTEQELSLYLSPEATRSGQVRFWIAQGYMKDQSVNSVTPTPERVESSSDRVTFVFNVTPGREAPIYFELEPSAYGPTSGEFGLEGEPGVAIHQLVLP